MEPLTLWKDAKFRRSFYQIRRLLQAGVNEWQPNMSTAKRHNCTGVKFLDDSFRENDLPLFDGARPRSGTGFIGRSAIKDFDGDLCYIVLFQKVRLRSDFAALRTENDSAAGARAGRFPKHCRWRIGWHTPCFSCRGKVHEGPDPGRRCFPVSKGRDAAAKRYHHSLFPG